METFDTTKKPLADLLSDIKVGKIQLPDFQRGWVWDDNRIKGLIASVIKSFPISVVTLLETGKNTSFKTKPVEGVNISNDVKPEYLILDGQQRLTSLYQTIVSNNVVKTRNSKGYEIKRWYYIDMQKALNPDLDLEEAIFSINENKIATQNIGHDIICDLSSQEKEFENMMFPVCMIDEFSEWRWRFEEYWNYDTSKLRFLSQFERYVINNYSHYSVPVIVMKKENSKEAVCQVFEKVNTGGVSLTVFELLTATYAASGFDLKKDWENIHTLFNNYKVLKNTCNTDLIQAVTLLSTYKKKQNAIQINNETEKIPAVSAKRKSMLELKVEEYEDSRQEIVDGFIKAAELLTSNHIFTARDLPYSSQLIPMSAIIAVLGKEIDNIGNKNKLMRWFWCGVFGELYGSANETRYALDIQQVVAWILNDDKEPQTIYDAVFSPSRLQTLRTRNSAAYKGIYALLMGENTTDWLTGSKIEMDTYFQKSIDIHHIFPRLWCENNKIPKSDYDTIINKTPLSKGTNIFVGGEAPSKYLLRLEKKAKVSSEDIDNLLRTHVINPELVRSDRFYDFIDDRKESIFKLMENAMGKPIIRDAQNINEEGTFIDNDIDEEEQE